MVHLLEKLQQYAKEDVYPYHMPGHKRREWGELPKECCEIDITEVEGFDNLHQPEGILEELQQRAARLYGAEESFYLINGSTSGVMSAVSSALPAGGRILMARNCHRSAYHAAYLRNLKISYLYPTWMQEYDICDAVTPEQVRLALERNPDTEAVLIVSPTYEGRIADVEKIAAAAHEKGIPLIVDEAHGAHLGLAGGWPANSCMLGADLVVHSVHKTLPALTQTALLHVNKELIDREKLRRFLKIYQSSSPSYLLMASIDNALQYAQRDGGRAFEQFRVRFFEMLSVLEACRNLKFLPRDKSQCAWKPEPSFQRRVKSTEEQNVTGKQSSAPERGVESENPQRMEKNLAQRGGQDIGKLVISVKGTCLTGKELYDILLKDYRLQMEMAAESFVLAMFTVNDGEEAYRRLTEALLEVDRRISGKPAGTKGRILIFESAASGTAEGSPPPIPLARAWDGKKEPILLKESAGRCAGEFVNLYPPGIPLLVPGEQITERLCQEIFMYIRQGLNVQGVSAEGERVYIQVIME